MSNCVESWWLILNHQFKKHYNSTFIKCEIFYTQLLRKFKNLRTWRLHVYESFCVYCVTLLVCVLIFYVSLIKLILREAPKHSQLRWNMKFLFHSRGFSIDYYWFSVVDYLLLSVHLSVFVVVNNSLEKIS